MGLLGRSNRIDEIRQQIQKLGPSRIPVLIQGESGTGKEVVARGLFDAAPKGQFVPIDCGSLVGPLMESELFGHTRGAFTGASEAKKGLIELANGGTAFFDEIGDLPIELQVKLLRVLQEREYRPVGSLQRMKVEIRILAATHRNLPREIAAGRFREDLYHRLNVIRLTLPPLRERKDDIPELLDLFLEATGVSYTIAVDAMEAIMKYNWPGNVRELKNCVDRMVAFNSGPLLHFGDLPSPVANDAREFVPPPLTFAAAAGAGQSRSEVFSFRHAAAAAAQTNIIPLYDVERRAIERALTYTHGDRTTAAHLLGIGRTTLYRKLKEYGYPPGGPEHSALQDMQSMPNSPDFPPAA